MSTCAQNTQQGGDGSVREGEMVQRSSPLASGGSSNHNKPVPSQQQQVKPIVQGLKLSITIG